MFCIGKHTWSLKARPSDGGYHKGRGRWWDGYCITLPSNGEELKKFKGDSKGQELGAVIMGRQSQVQLNTCMGYHKTPSQDYIKEVDLKANIIAESQGCPAWTTDRYREFSL